MNNLIKIAASQLGVSEIKGKNDNPAIIKYAFESGFINYSHDEIPWCSIFINWCCRKVGLEYTGKTNARSWLEVGIKISNPKPGDLVIFWRKSLSSVFGHVAIFLGYGKDMKSVFVLGGNQSDSVSISEYSVIRILAFKRLKNTSSSLLPKPILRNGSTGNEVVILQNLLNKLKYNCGKVDGIFGSKTESGLKLFQRDNDLVVDGIYGVKTLGRLKKEFHASGKYGNS